jgi:hypothetical protein
MDMEKKNTQDNTHAQMWELRDAVKQPSVKIIIPAKLQPWPLKANASVPQPSFPMQPRDMRQRVETHRLSFEAWGLLGFV